MTVFDEQNMSFVFRRRGVFRPLHLAENKLRISHKTSRAESIPLAVQQQRNHTRSPFQSLSLSLSQ